MTVHFEDLPLADMVKALDAKLDAASAPSPRPDVVVRNDSDTVARARAQLAAAEVEARRRAGEEGETGAGEATEKASPRRSGLSPRGGSLDDAVSAVLAGLREFSLEPQFRETLRQRATRHLPTEEPVEGPKPWEALGLTREIWARLKKAGKLKED